MRREDWLSPMNRLVWMKAFRAKSNTVTIRDGREFKLRYSTQTIFGEDMDMVWVEPKKGFAPAGWFRMKHVTDELWLTESSEPYSQKESMYVNLLKNFMDSGYKGVDVMQHYPNLEGRVKTSVRQGFASAIIQVGQKASNIVVKTIDGKVYLFKGVDV